MTKGLDHLSNWWLTNPWEFTDGLTFGRTLQWKMEWVTLLHLSHLKWGRSAALLQSCLKLCSGWHGYRLVTRDGWMEYVAMLSNLGQRWRPQSLAKRSNWRGKWLQNGCSWAPPPLPVTMSKCPWAPFWNPISPQSWRRWMLRQRWRVLKFWKPIWKMTICVMCERKYSRLLRSTLWKVLKIHLSLQSPHWKVVIKVTASTWWSSTG